MTEPIEEPTEIEPLEWLCALERRRPVTWMRLRLLLDSGSGVPVCSPDSVDR